MVAHFSLLSPIGWSVRLSWGNRGLVVSLLARLFGCGVLAFFPGCDDDFEAAVFTRFERAVRLENVVERVSLRNKAVRVDEPLLDEGKRLFEPRCIHAARFEDEILAVHAGQRQRLIILVHSGNHHHGVGPRDVP